MSDKTKAISSAPLKRAYGRSLRDFRIAEKGTLHGLLPAEEKLLDATARGEPCTIGHALPDDENEDNQVRGAFLRFLLLGGDGEAPVHEEGIQIFGAFVRGDIDLDNAVAVVPLSLRLCRIPGKFLGNNARLGPLVLNGSHIQSIACDRAKITGSVFLSDDFTAEGEVRFPGAEIGGDLACWGGNFQNLKQAPATDDGNPPEAKDALYLVGARISGTLWLGLPARAPNDQQAKFDGSINLQDAYVKVCR